eukprot:s49_g20.t1
METMPRSSAEHSLELRLCRLEMRTQRLEAMTAEDELVLRCMNSTAHGPFGSGRRPKVPLPQAGSFGSAPSAP